MSSFHVACLLALSGAAHGLKLGDFKRLVCQYVFSEGSAQREGRNCAHPRLDQRKLLPECRYSNLLAEAEYGSWNWYGIGDLDRDDAGDRAEVVGEK